MIYSVYRCLTNKKQKGFKLPGLIYLTVPVEVMLKSSGVFSLDNPISAIFRTFPSLKSSIFAGLMSLN